MFNLQMAGEMSKQLKFWIYCSITICIYLSDAIIIKVYFLKKTLKVLFNCNNYFKTNYQKVT